MEVKMIIRRFADSQNQFEKYESWGVFSDDDNILMSSASLNTVLSRYGKQYLSTLTFGGVQTAPEYRRKGYVRKIFEKAFDMAPERGWVVSLLHPFSYSYYRMFGFEKITDHKLAEFPISKLDCISRCSSLKLLCSNAMIEDALSIFERFSEHRDIMFKRFDGRYYSLNPASENRYTYIWYDENGKPASYITLGKEGKTAVIYEIAFVSRSSLLAALGFVRMFEGELETVKILNYVMFPELDFVLRHYTQTKYTAVPDIMGRILNVEKFLQANNYPDEKGHFIIKIEDTLKYTRGTYEVEYQNGNADIRKINDTDKYDIAAEMPAMTQLLYGYESYTAESVKYMNGVDIKTPAKDFFRAFPKKVNGLFEHF